MVCNYFHQIENSRTSPQTVMTDAKNNTEWIVPITRLNSWFSRANTTLLSNYYMQWNNELGSGISTATNSLMWNQVHSRVKFLLLQNNHNKRITSIYDESKSTCIRSTWFHSETTNSILLCYKQVESSICQIRTIWKVI